MSERGAVARLEGVERRFGTVTALAGADLLLGPGEVHGVLGANGAGKTTLLGILGGMLAPDAGVVEVAGRRVRFGSPRDAWAHGIALVHQHFTLVPALTALENLALGRRFEVARAGSRRRSLTGLALDLDGVRAEVGSLSERTGLRVPLDRPAGKLGVGDRQRAEILKALLRDPGILVLDEPTAVLAPQEVEGLFGLLRELAAGGRTVVLVAHKLDEVRAVADRVTVLRDGRTVLSGPISEMSTPALVRAMVGPEADTGLDPASVRTHRPGVGTPPSASRARDGERASTAERRSLAPADSPWVARLERVHLFADAGSAPDGRDRASPPPRRTTPAGSRSGPSDRRARLLDGVSLVVTRGEIVGVAGVEGNGQHELALVLAGRLGVDEGGVTLPAAVGYVPEDRSTQGLIAAFDLTENLALALQHDDRFRSGAWLRWGALAEEAEALRRRYGVAAPSVETRAATLSGGNQQRVVVGRELAVGTDLLVAENPTRGLDVSATSFVWAELRRLTGDLGRGPGVVLVSTDLDEVLELSDRVFAMSRGRLIAVPEERRTREGVGALMLASERG